MYLEESQIATWIFFLFLFVNLNNLLINKKRRNTIIINILCFCIFLWLSVSSLCTAIGKPYPCAEASAQAHGDRRIFCESFLVSQSCTEETQSYI